MQTSGVHTINKSNADANLFKSNVPNIRTEAMLQEFKNQVLAVFWQNLRIISKLKPCNMQECKKEKNTKHLTTMGQAKHPCECGLGKVRQCMHFLMKFLGWSKIILVWISPLPSSVFVTMSVKQGMQANRIQYSALAWIHNYAPMFHSSFSWGSAWIHQWSKLRSRYISALEKARALHLIDDNTAVDSSCEFHTVEAPCLIHECPSAISFHVIPCHSDATSAKPFNI